MESIKTKRPMKKILLSLILVASFLASFAQSGSVSYSGVFTRVNDSTTYIAAAATKHAQGYSDIFFNNQAVQPHFDVWNGSSYDHVFNWGGGGSGWGTSTDPSGTLSGTWTIDGNEDVKFGSVTPLSSFNTTTSATGGNSTLKQLGNYTFISSRNPATDSVYVMLDPYGGTGGQVELGTVVGTKKASINVNQSFSTPQVDIIADDTGTASNIHVDNSTISLSTSNQLTVLISGDTGSAGQVLGHDGISVVWADPASGTNNILTPEIKTSSFTLAATDTSSMIVLDAASDLVITLPDFSAINKGMQFAFFRKQTDSVYFAAGGQTYLTSAGNLGGVPINSYMYVYYNYIDNEFYISNGGTGGGGGGGSGTVDNGTAGQIAVYTGATTVDGATTGTGVVTALGVNVGTSGSVVVNGGALGTPSSGTGTNLTGIPQSGVTSLTSDLALKAPLASPALTGSPTAPTQSQGDGSTKIATTAYVDAAIGSSQITERKKYYYGEYRINRTINTSTGATSSSATYDVTDYIEIEPSTEIEIFSSDFSNIIIYGWTYDASFTAISEIRSNVLIGTPLTTYTFTTPSNAKYIQVYTRNGGVASDVVIGWRSKLQIQSTGTVTYSTPIRPENYSGTDTQKIQAAIDVARWSSSPVHLNGKYDISEAIIVYSNTKLILNGTIKGAVGLRDNFIRNEAVRNPSIILNRGNRHIVIEGTGTFEGSDEAWGGYPASGVSGQSWRAIGILLANVEQFTLDGFKIKSSAMWGICMEQSRYGKVQNIEFDQDGRVSNQDGVNVRRGSHDVAVRNIYGTTYDDAVAVTNLVIGGDLNVLGTTIYEPFLITLDMFNITIDNIDMKIETTLASYSPPHYGGGVLIMCEDGLKVFNISVSNVKNPRAHLYLGFTSIQYWSTTQCVVGDMYNLTFTDIVSPIYIRRPLVNCSFTNCSKYDYTGINKSVVIIDGSLKVSRKYKSENYEWFETVPVFVPTSIANLNQWYDFSDAATLTLSGSLITQANDKSGNALHVSETSTARPTITSAVTGINNKTVALFTGSTALRRAKITALQGVSGLTIFMVGGRSSIANGSVVWHGFDFNERTQVTNGGTASFGIIGNNTGQYGTYELGQTTLQRTTIVYDGSLSGNSNRLKMYVNGEARSMTFSGTIPATTESNASSKFALGALDIASPVYVGGAIGEVLIYTRALTALEIEQVEEYLQSKWGF